MQRYNSIFTGYVIFHFIFSCITMNYLFVGANTCFIRLTNDYVPQLSPIVKYPFLFITHLLALVFFITYVLISMKLYHVLISLTLSLPPTLSTSHLLLTISVFTVTEKYHISTTTTPLILLVLLLLLYFWGERRNAYTQKGLRNSLNVGLRFLDYRLQLLLILLGWNPLSHCFTLLLSWCTL